MKRFTASEKWDDPWFWELSPMAKLLWLFLLDHCDNAGIIEVSFKFTSMKIGGTVNEKHLAELQSRLHALPCGKFLITGFIRFQYGTLSRDCKPHNPVYASLAKHGLEITQLETLSKGFVKGLETLQDKEKDKDKEPEQDSAQKNKKFLTPSLEEVKLVIAKTGLPESDAVWFWNKCEGNGWTNGGKPIKSWPNVIASWKAAGYMASQRGGFNSSGPRTETKEEENARIVLEAAG